MLLTTLIVLGSILLLVVLALVGLRILLSTRLGRERVAPWLARQSWVQRLVMRGMRKQAEREGRSTDERGRPVSDLELMIDAAAESSEEARQAKAMLAGMTPQQRAQAARMMRKMSTTDAQNAPEISLGRAERRAAARAARKKGKP